jgi:hypothetical protein
MLLVLLPSQAGAGAWPTSSKVPVRPLEHASVETRTATCRLDPNSGFRFIVFGGQAPEADGDWQEMMERIGKLARADSTLLFMADAGGFVQNGRYSDQFRMATEILAPAALLPYWACAGNQEVGDNRSPRARANTVLFLSSIDAALRGDRLYYAKSVGPLRCLFLDSNDLVYGPDGHPAELNEPEPGSRAEAQLLWLEGQLGEGPVSPEDSRVHPGVTVAFLHHPFIQSSEKDSDQARRLWDYRFRGRTLPEMLTDGGVSVVFCAHAETDERFRLRRADGRELQVINLSGHPQPSSVLRFRKVAHAENMRGSEMETLREWGWRGLGLWTITQEDAMLDREADPMGLVTVGGDGTLELEVAFLDPQSPNGLRLRPPVILHRPGPEQVVGPTPEH